MKLKNLLLMGLSLVLVAAIAIGGTVAYLTSEDSAVNVMTLGNVSIEQIEQERDANGELVDFTQAKPAYPVVGPIAWADKGVDVNGTEYKVFTDELKNVVDKIVTVKNTGKSDAYIRTIVAIEAPDYDPDDLIHINCNGDVTQSAPVTVEIEGVKYVVFAFTYADALAPGKTSAPSLMQIFLDSKATNEDCAKFGDAWDILVLSQAVQTAGFDDAQTALDTGFGEMNAENVAKWFEGIEYPVLGTQVSAENFAEIDFTAKNERFVFNGEFKDVNVSELGEGSVLYFNNATVADLSFEDDAVIEGSATINKIHVVRNGADPISVTLRDADLNVAGEVSVNNTDGKSILNIENTKLKSASIYVGEHVNNHRSAQAELNIVDSYVSCEENGMGSTINVWGRSGVKATIYDSEIYTYSRGWHQSEDANDNSITFQGATSIDVDIQRSNMHLYGARSIVNARQYGSEATTIKTNIDESLIWVVTKSSHGENTIPVWGFDESNIKNSILLFTKNVHQSTPAVFKSFVYGNPVIHGDYHVTTQCQWDAPIELADGQTVTFASDANVSVYEDAGKVEFVKNGSAKVVVENGAVVENITIN